ncbi:hypothetical protein SLEP1_g52687 [Rubroshorea leprosula]|uniref:Uncharacterized protein n=1 Tax=Rubroshorea leprosula TaxID=152421 RepID=A0AAV5M9R5_9ROSI|nr:hypothetical protein SLEP1_g52687 [Rubroshorea leprosula]
MNPGAWVHREPRMNPAHATRFTTGLAMNPARAWVRDIPRRKLGERGGSILSVAKALCELQLELHQQSSSFEVVEVGRKTRCRTKVEAKGVDFLIIESSFQSTRVK